MDTTYIYTLTDPISGLIRYVGKSDKPNKRIKEHIRKSNIGVTHKNNCIKSLLRNGLTPIIEVIDEVPMCEWGFWKTTGYH